MDIATRTWIRRIATALFLAAAVMTLGATRSAPAPAPLTIYGADAEDEAAVDWALHRFRAGELPNLPPLEVHLHGSHDACNGGLGLYFGGRIDLCTKDSSEAYARKFAIHEIAHAWTETNVGASVLDRFMSLRAIERWNDRRDAWKERGTEQAAEIITWGLGEGEIAPLLPDELDIETMAELYELLTGERPINPTVL